MPNEKHTVKQHFVPQFYLKEFANNEGQLRIFDAEKRRRSKPRAYGAVCYKPYFYGMRSGYRDDVSQSIERHFDENIENPLSNVWPSLIQRIGDPTQPISIEDRYLLSNFIIHMWLRNPSTRDFINGTNEQVMKHIAKVAYGGKAAEITIAKQEKNTGEKLTPAQKENLISFAQEGDYSIDFNNKEHLRFMLDPEHQAGFSNLMFHKDWVIHISKASRQFMTSDTPVVEVTPKSTGIYGASFMQRTHFFPLVPSILLEARPPKSHSIKKIKRKTYLGSNVGKIDEINAYLMSHSRYVYSHSDQQIDWCVSLSAKVSETDFKLQQLADRCGFEVQEVKDFIEKLNGLPKKKKGEAIEDYFLPRIKSRQ